MLRGGRALRGGAGPGAGRRGAVWRCGAAGRRGGPALPPPRAALYCRERLAGLSGAAAILGRRREEHNERRGRAGVRPRAAAAAAGTTAPPPGLRLCPQQRRRRSRTAPHRTVGRPRAGTER